MGVAFGLVAAYGLFLHLCGDMTPDGNAAVVYETKFLGLFYPAPPPLWHPVAKIAATHYTWWPTVPMFGFMALMGAESTLALRAARRPRGRAARPLREGRPRRLRRRLSGRRRGIPRRPALRARGGGLKPSSACDSRLRLCGNREIIRPMETCRKSAFTLIELLVVIGIIGVLSAVMIGVLGGTSNAARATQCMNNLRSLSIAAITYATMTDSDRVFPRAGSYSYRAIGAAGYYWDSRKGWISWDDKGGGGKSAGGAPYISFSESNPETLRYAITNGCIWASGGKSERVYLCPVHDAACLKANGRHPGWSYVMNESFYWQGDGKKSWRGQKPGGMIDARQSSSITAGRPPEKVLLFAEIQGLDVNDGKITLTANVNGSGNQGDGVLQYASGQEVIGFNHELGGGKYFGHVAFADGHVEKVAYPQNHNVKDLTLWLCSGREITFDGSNYRGE